MHEMVQNETIGNLDCILWKNSNAKNFIGIPKITLFNYLSALIIKNADMYICIYKRSAHRRKYIDCTCVIIVKIQQE